MADKNDAREWLDKNGYDNPRMTKYNKPDGENNPSLSDVLTAYAAAVTQERDALRDDLQERDGIIRGLMDVIEGKTEPLPDIARAAAEESQPK